MRVKFLRGRIPDGYLPQRQKVKSATVVGMSEFSHEAAYGQGRISDGRYAAIYAAIVASPGIGPSRIAKSVGLSRGSVKSALVNMDYHGFLLYEDDYGQMYPFEL